MTDAQRRVDEQGRTVVTDRGEAAQLARGWLLLSAERPDVAALEWRERGAALLECGREFSVVRMQPEVVWAAVGSQRMADVDAELKRALDGPVFMSLYPHRYYALVPVNAGLRYEWAVQSRDDARFLGGDSVVAVPLPGRVEPDGARPYWCVPVREPGVVCSSDAVSRFLAHGRFRLAQKRGGQG
ncbi:hypothetical protein GR925_27590 [Streptomyces sp. HUCO-GS316]|uniref:hypothetical protein n=1 Tax=Streptomyces sp. HUCO-GS316 TaxID=2692198 RepID=UPI001367EFA0|nr:hypothetical protein [Streptomyces sp. HUCO-GS316]MXM67090.1 hypothetical protein [Streptomyces sp. HUCO-GS316]